MPAEDEKQSSRPPPERELAIRSPGAIVLAYAALAAVWAQISDAAIQWLFGRNAAVLAYLPTVRRLGFIAVTASLLYFLLRRGNRRLAAAHNALELREVEGEAERSRIERIARLGHWIWKLDPERLDWQGGHIEHSDSAAAIFGVTPAELAISNRAYMDRFVHPADRERVAKAFAALDTGYTVEYRILRPDGEVRTLFEVAENVYDRSGRYLLTQGTMQDITDQRQTERVLVEYQGRLDMALWAAKAAYWELDPRTGIHKMMESYYSMLGYPLEESPRERQAWLGLVHPEDVKRLEASLRLAPFDDRDHECEFRIKAKDGSWRWMLSRFRAAAYDEQGQPTRLQGIDSDITARKEAELAVQLERNRARLYLDVAGAILVVLDVESRVVLLNRRGSETLGISERDAIGKNWFDAFSPPEEREVQRASYSAFLAGERGPGQDIEMTLVTAAGEVRLITWHDTLLRNDEGRIVGGISSGEDITVRRKLEARLEELVTRDELTGAFNRRHFMTQAPAEMKRALRYRRPLSFIFLDLDDFKSINDRCGHATGDEVLKAFSRLSEETFRPTDLFARYGGEEFVVMLPESTMAQAVGAAERLRTAMRTLVIPADPPIRGLTASVGVGALLGEGDSLDSILERIDQAAYQAKAGGKDRIVVTSKPSSEVEAAG